MPLGLFPTHCRAIHVIAPLLQATYINRFDVFQVRHRSSPIFKRLKDIVADPKRKFSIFVNEHRRETYEERKPGESANDRNDRAIRTAAKWFKEEHLKR